MEKSYQYGKTDTGYIIAVNEGEEVMSTLSDFFREKNVRTATLTGLGSANHATLRFTDPRTGAFKDREFDELLTVINLTGNVFTVDGIPHLLLHASLGRSDFSCVSGEIINLHISGFSEFIVQEFTGTSVERRLDSLSGRPILYVGKPDPTKPLRGYPDAFWTQSRREEMYNGNDDWTIYYADQDWLDFLLYQMVLTKKGYQYEGGTPSWVTAYIDRFEYMVPESADPVRLVIEKAGWARLQITFYPHGEVSPDGMTYTMSTRITPGQDLLSGRPGVALRPSQYEPYAKHRELVRSIEAGQ